MTKYEKNRANISNGNFAKYVERKQMHQRSCFRYKPDGSTFYVIGNAEIPEKDFKEMYPIGLISRSKYNDRADPRQKVIY